jgi:hypothetical protein
LNKVAATLAPNSPLLSRIRDYQFALDRIARDIKTTITTIFVEERRVSNVDKAAASGGGTYVNGVYIPPGIDFSKLADGKIVNSPEIALIGEAGPEVIIPLTRPQRALELMQQSGLIGMTNQGVGSDMNTASSSISMVGSSKATVNIESANFYDGTDANLVAQKVNAAQQARSFSR